MMIQNYIPTLKKMVLLLVVLSLTACATPETYKDPQMDFGSVYTVAVMPFTNLTNDQRAADRVRDVFMTLLFAMGDVYVLPQGEVSRGLALVGAADPTALTQEQAKKFARTVKADALISGVVREYGEVRSGSATANAISFSLQMTEAQTGKVVMSVSTTQGGIGMADRLFGGGGEPMNTITEKAVRDAISKMYQ